LTTSKWSKYVRGVGETADFYDTGDTMTDKHGHEITVGQPCRFYSAERKEWLPGNVRAIGQSHAFSGLAYVDDGDPAVDEYPANGAVNEAWVQSYEIDVSNGWNDGEGA
jgi:hypothetical protein